MPRLVTFSCLVGLCYFCTMNQERIAELEKLIREDPNDPFLPYAQALEWSRSVAHLSEAIRLLSDLKQTHPAYLPLYYQLASFNLKAGKKADAVLAARQGLELAVLQKNRHAASELEFLLDEMDDE